MITPDEFKNALNKLNQNEFDKIYQSLINDIESNKNDSNFNKTIKRVNTVTPSTHLSNDTIIKLLKKDGDKFKINDNTYKEIITIANYSTRKSKAILDLLINGHKIFGWPINKDTLRQIIDIGNGNQNDSSN